VRQGEATSCGARGHQIKNLGVGLFARGGVDILYVNMGSLGNRKNPLYIEGRSG
jgi:hypothetical protein